MNENRINETILYIFENIHFQLKNELNIDTEIEELENTIILNNNFFILGHEKKEKYDENFIFKFMISFSLDTNTKTVAELMKVFLTYISPNEIFISELFYFNKNTQEYYYGTEAFESKIEYFHHVNGRAKCSVCDRYFPLENFENEEYCICNNCCKNLEKIKWN